MDLFKTPVVNPTILIDVFNALVMCPLPLRLQVMQELNGMILGIKVRKVRKWGIKVKKWGIKVGKWGQR